MIPINFLHANVNATHPTGMTPEQVATIPVFKGIIENPGSTCVGLPIMVTAWQPTETERLAIAGGGAVYVTFLADRLPPHFPSVTFNQATNPA